MIREYSFYIDGLLLPVTPSKLDTKITGKNKTVDLANGETLNIPRAPGLTEFEFEFELPSVNTPYAKYDTGFVAPEVFLTRLEQLKTGRTPFRFIVVRNVTTTDQKKYIEKRESYADKMLISLIDSSSGSSESMSPTVKTVVVEDYTITEDAEKGFRDFFVTIKLREYKKYAIKRVTYSVKGDTGSSVYSAGYIVQTRGSPLTIRSGAGKANPQVGSIPNGTIVDVTGEPQSAPNSSTLWIPVEYNGVKGFCSGNYLVKYTKTYICENAVKVRENATSSSAEKGEIKVGDRIEVYEVKNGWVKHKWQGEYRWSATVGTNIVYLREVTTNG